MPYVCRITYPRKYYVDDYHEGKIVEAVGLSSDCGLILGTRKTPDKRDLGYVRATKEEAEAVAEKVLSLGLVGVKTKVEMAR